VCSLIKRQFLILYNEDMSSGIGGELARLSKNMDKFESKRMNFRVEFIVVGLLFALVVAEFVFGFYLYNTQKFIVETETAFVEGSYTLGEETTLDASD
jgi:hypothetical protein